MIPRNLNILCAIFIILIVCSSIFAANADNPVENILSTIGNALQSWSTRPQNTKYLKDITVVYTKDKASEPRDSVEVNDGLDGDINAGFGGDHVWLVPVWTTDVDKAATSVEIIVQSKENTMYSGASWHQELVVTSGI